MKAPEWLRPLVAGLPSYPPSLLAALVVNLWAGQFLNGRNLPAARGKIIAIDVCDAGLVLHFTVSSNGIIACRRRNADATISASAADFLALARREIDPDTLFFNRRLLMQGDTELGLLVKNTLDAMERPAFKLPSPRRVIQALALQLGSEV